MAIFVSSGQVSSGIILNNDSMYVYSGGTAVDTTVENGVLNVSSGGAADFTRISANGGVNVYNGGAVRDTTVVSGGYLGIGGGGKVTGSLEIASGGVVSAYGGSIVDFDISDVYGSSAALVNNISLISGAPNYTITVSADQDAGVYTLAGGAAGFTGTFTIGTDGSNYGAIAVNGDTLAYRDLTYTLATADSDLILTVTFEPNDSFETADDLGTITSSVTLDHLSLSSGDKDYFLFNLDNAAFLSLETDGLSNGDSMLFLYDADRNQLAQDDDSGNGYYSKLSRTLTAGSYYVLVNPYGTGSLPDYSLTFTLSDHDPSVISGLVLIDSAYDVSSGYTALDTQVSSGGILNVMDFGSAISTTVNSSGILNVSNGAAVSTTLNNGGKMNVVSGWAETNAVKSGGTLNVGDWGRTYNTTVSSGGILNVSSNGWAEDITLDRGGMNIYGGGSAGYIEVRSGSYLGIGGGAIVTGSLQIAAGAVVSAYAGSIINFDIGGINGSSAALVNDLSLLRGTPDYTITVSTSQAEGTYTLAGGAAGFTGTLSIGTYESDYGTITVNGDEQTYGDCTYTLATAGGDLILTVINSGFENAYDLGTITSSVTLEHLSLSSGEKGYYRFNLGEATYLTVETDGVSGGDTMLYLYDSDKKQFAMDDDSGNGYYSLLNVRLEPGTYYAVVRPYGSNALSDYSLTLTLSDSDPTVTSGLVLIDSTYYVSSGYTVLETNVSSGGWLEVYEGGTASGTTVNKGGWMGIHSSGSATAIMENGGYVYVEYDGNATFTPNTFSGLVLDNVSATVHSGTTAVSTTIVDGGWMGVNRGGIATGTTIDDGGWVDVYSRGIVNSATVNFGGDLEVSSGGSATAIMENGGYVYVEDGGRATFTPNTFSGVALDRYATVHSGTTAVSTTVNYGGWLGISSGGSATAIMENGGYVYVEDDGYATFTPNTFTGVALDRYFSATVHSGTTANSTTVNSGARLEVYAGGKVTGSLEIASGAVVSAYDGSIIDFDISARTAASPALMDDLSLISGTPDYTITVSADQAGGVYTLAGGASAFTGTLSIGTDGSNYGTATVNGAALTYGDYTFWLIQENDDLELVVGNPSTLIVSDLYICNSGTYDQAIVLSEFPGGFLLNGGTVNHTDLYGDMYVTGDSNIYDTVVHSDGWLDIGYSRSGEAVGNRGTADGITVRSGGFLRFCGDGENNTILPGETVTISVTDVTVEAGGSINGFTFDHDVVFDDAVHGVVISNVTIDNFEWAVVVKDWTVSNITVGSYGSLNVHKGGSAANITVHAGGEINGFSFGDETVVIADASNLSHATVLSAGYVFDGQTATDIGVASESWLTVYEGGSVTDIIIDSCGELNVHKGGSVTNITVLASGTINGFSFGDETVVLSDASSFSNAMVEDWASVYAGQTATDIRVGSGGRLNVYEGGSAANITVLASGTINGFSFGDETVVIADASNLSDVTVDSYASVYAGQTAKNVTVGSGCSLSVAEGGKVTGSLEIASGAAVSVSEGGIIDFDISARTAFSPALVNNLSLIEGSPAYTITVAAEQTAGVYTLADGAAGFAQTVTICNTDGICGSLAVGNSVTLGERDYALNLDSSLLTLTVSGGTPVVSGTAGDLNGDGRADIVMTIDQSAHPADGATGAWLIQENQIPVWGDLSQRNAGWEIFGMGWTSPGKPTNDVYVRNSDNVIGAWTTDNDGVVNGWETIGSFDPDAQIVGLGDFNGNGQSDLLLRAANGAVGCYFTDGQGWNYFQSLGDEWKLSAIGDLNGDGRADVVLAHDAGFAGCWLTQADGTPMWAGLDTLANGFEIIGAGDFNGDGTDDVLLKNGSYYGAWLVQNGNAVGWLGIGDLGDAAVEQISDFNADGVDDLRIRTAGGDLGALLVMGEDSLDWKYYGSVGAEWNTSLAALS